MGESTAPFGEIDTRQSARKKIFELTTASPADFFTHISPRLDLSKVKIICWCGNIISASSLPDIYKEKLLALKDKRITKEGIIVIKSQQHRSQEQNRDKALERLAELIKSVNTVQKKRIATKPTKGSVSRRLRSKKKHNRLYQYSIL